jgi:hypothetical protein
VRTTGIGKKAGLQTIVIMAKGNKGIRIFGLISSGFLFLSSLLLLLDISPAEHLPYFKSNIRAYELLKENKIILKKSVVSVAEKMYPDRKYRGDTETFNTLKKLIKRNSKYTSTVKWDKVVGIAYQTVNIPVGSKKLDAFQPLYVIYLQKDREDEDIEAIGYLENFSNWLYAERQAKLTSTALFLLCCGFILQMLTFYKDKTDT